MSVYDICTIRSARAACTLCCSVVRRLESTAKKKQLNEMFKLRLIEIAVQIIIDGIRTQPIWLILLLREGLAADLVPNIRGACDRFHVSTANTLRALDLQCQSNDFDSLLLV